MLYPHQKAILKSNPNKIILAWATSLGKTLALIELAKQNKVNPLIICPKSLKERWNRDCPNGAVITKEEFRRDWNEILDFDAIIVDEIAHFSGKSQMSKALLSYIKKHEPKYVWGASATPYRSTPWNVYQLALIMGRDWSFTVFREAFFRIQYFGPKMVWVPKTTELSRERLAKALAKFCDIVSAEDANMPPEDVFEEEIFYLTPKQKKAMKDIKIEEPNPVVQYGKAHQIAQGFLKGDEFTEDKLFENEKIPRIVELAEEHKSMLIFAKYTLQIKMIQEALEKSGHKVYVLTGATKNRQEMIEAVSKDEDCILISQTALGEGWEVPKFDFIVFASLPWSYDHYLQCIGRASRVNKPKRRVYLTMTAKDSIDEKVKEALDKKQDFYIELNEI